MKRYLSHSVLTLCDYYLNVCYKNPQLQKVLWLSATITCGSLKDTVKDISAVYLKVYLEESGMFICRDAIAQPACTTIHKSVLTCELQSQLLWVKHYLRK